MTQDSPQRLNYGLHSEPIYPRLRLCLRTPNVKIIMPEEEPNVEST
jgi:hypothetical protein